MTDGTLRIDGPLSGPENMAIDQALLERVRRGGPPVLRFYQWNPATLSIGYFQHLSDRQTHEPSAGVPIVRRSTGGGAILHDRELTYSLILPIPDRSSKNALAIYRRMHAAIRGALGVWGIPLVPCIENPRCRLSAGDDEPFLCFQRRSGEDLLLHDFKVVGSAQRRVDSALLQHGSILLASSPAAPELPGIMQLAGIAPVPEQLAAEITRRCVDLFGICWNTTTQCTPSGEEIAQWISSRFASLLWTQRRE